MFVELHIQQLEHGLIPGKEVRVMAPDEELTS